MKRFLTLSLALLALVPLSAEPEYPAMGPDLYDAQADGFALIKAALARAKAEHKTVLLDFGANWCPWCRKLDQTMASNPALAAKVASDYVVVMIDVNMRKGVKRNTDVNTKYGNPIHEGLPVLVVLDADGKQLATQETGALEEGDHHDPAKVLKFLSAWAPKK
jgi:thiol:disulfide interchange protein